jgi:hypothetical protein
MYLNGINKLTDPPVAFIVFLAVADENVVFVARDYACHGANII